MLYYSPILFHTVFPFMAEDPSLLLYIGPLSSASSIENQTLINYIFLSFLSFFVRTVFLRQQKLTECSRYIKVKTEETVLPRTLRVDTVNPHTVLQNKIKTLKIQSWCWLRVSGWNTEQGWIQNTHLFASQEADSCILCHMVLKHLVLFSRSGPKLCKNTFSWCSRVAFHMSCSQSPVIDQPSAKTVGSALRVCMHV